MNHHEQFMRQAIELASENVKNGGGPFGALVVKDGIIIGKGTNRVTANNDPTAHAEVVAIRDACSKLGSFQLSGCDIYCSCEPCPMCFGAIYWARPRAVYFAATRFMAAEAGFDDSFIYTEISANPDERKWKFIATDLPETGEPFRLWKDNPAKSKY